MLMLTLADVVLSEHQELVEEIDATRHRRDREDLKVELERLVARMDEKGAQITKLRKHWKMVRRGEITVHCSQVSVLILLLLSLLLIDLK